MEGVGAGEVVVGERDAGQNTATESCAGLSARGVKSFGLCRVEEFHGEGLPGAVVGATQLKWETRPFVIGVEGKVEPVFDRP